MPSPRSIASSEHLRVLWRDVGGIDAIFLGTFDLAHELEHFGDNGVPEVARQIDRIGVLREGRE